MIRAVAVVQRVSQVLARSPPSTRRTTPGPWIELLDGARELLVEHRAVRDDDDLVEHGLVGLVVELDSRWASQAIEFDFPDPAECWIR